MEFKPLSIHGAFEIIPRFFTDDRGTFSTTYEATEFAKIGLSTNWIADNQSFNYKSGTLRGLHFQKPPSAQAKLVRALIGQVFDVLVDLRHESPTFLKWTSIVLNDETGNGVYVPKGCAHGYLSLVEKSIVSYKVDAPYDPNCEGGLLWNDATFQIVWPVVEKLTISSKDRAWPTFERSKNPFAVVPGRVASF